ncbi:hypothetical protein HK103_001023 [Boothiomyces macroporosus]|uniref:Uncharacterized protein n=1 Tax=Boothiomyces macroporosus TaxID=261099 RepID=A0AAD5UBA9_9FUNG|nr:hypothetical protein HK103_001023 [Boothiomyces macroporosus]
MKNVNMRYITEAVLFITHLGFMIVGAVFGCIDISNSPQLPPAASLTTKFPFLYYACSSVFFGTIVFSFNIIQSAIQADMLKSLMGQRNILWIIATVGNISIFLQTIAWSLILWNNFTNSAGLWLGSISELCLNAIFFIENGATVLTKVLCAEQVDIAATNASIPVRNSIVISEEDLVDLSKLDAELARMKVVPVQMIAYIAGLSTSILIMNILGVILRLRKVQLHTKFIPSLLGIATFSLLIFTSNYSILNTVNMNSITSKMTYYVSRISFALFCASHISMTTIKYLQVVKNKKYRELMIYIVLVVNFGMLVFGIIWGCIDVTIATTLPPTISLYTKIPTFYYAASSVLIGFTIFLVKLIKSAMMADLELSLCGQVGNNWNLWAIVGIGNFSVLSQTGGWCIVLWNTFVNNGSQWLATISTMCLNLIFFIENASEVAVGELSKAKENPVQSPNRSVHRHDLETT